ncbi:hypothetical protein J22TS1_46860 [Siminovitchia terrae]|uniref:hypothetical protein n=1 Tax=Siminovitchia terrae TaxID=1914933 RepID=UPI001B27A6C6|nr:hypothetical protein [Siminovitchia terrae]GIN93635.1 hypothetical protein J22TS1_46860 [Siminovitchia terrae]
MALYYINRAILRNNAYSKKSKRGNVIEDDLPIFFKHQQDREANHMSAFTSKDPNDWDSFTTHWNKILTDRDIIKQTIIVENTVVGHVLRFEQFGEP